MEQNKNIEQRLWEYMDGSCTPGERNVIEELLQNDVAWKSKYHELLELNKIIQSSDLDAPSMRFTKNVMEEIAKLYIAPATKTYINKKIIFSIASFFILMIVGFLIYGFAQMQWNAGNESTIVKNVNRIDFSRFFSNSYVNILMMINLVVGLFLLDNYLGRKRRAFQKEN